MTPEQNIELAQKLKKLAIELNNVAINISKVAKDMLKTASADFEAQQAIEKARKSSKN